MEEYAFKAVFGNTTIKGHTFTGVADALVERGFDVAKAVPDGEGVISIPHTQPRRRPARLWFEFEVQPPQPPTEEQLEAAAQIERAMAAGRAVLGGGMVPGLQTRPCGAVHSDGVVCLIPVLYEPLHCGCGDMVYPHEQAHEATDTEGVRYRWEEVLMIQDLPYDTYGSIEASA